MAKNPAVLFYTSDFLTGTALMTNEQVGAYIKLLCLQHQRGHLDKKDMLKICDDEEVFLKFKKDKKNKYFNQRMEEEISKRKKYSESRAKNRQKSKKDMKNICNSYEEHMENVVVNENVNENIITIIKYLESNNFILSSTQFEKINEYLEDFTADEIKEAFKETINHKKAFNYFEGIIRNWKNGSKKETPVWFDKKITSEKLTEEEQKELEEMMERYKGD